MLNTGYMEFFFSEKTPKTKDTDFLKSFFADDEKILFCFSGLRDRLAFFTSKRLIFTYTPDKASCQLDFVHYNQCRRKRHSAVFSRTSSATFKLKV